MAYSGCGSDVPEVGVISAEASKIMFKFGEGERKRERGGGGMGGIFFVICGVTL